MVNLPKKIFERDIESVRCGTSDIYFFKESEIENSQRGYRVNGLTGEPINDWIGDNYYVIGEDSSMGDPIITDISKEELPIYFMMHDDWSSLEMIAYNIEQFIEILHMIDETTITDEVEKDNLIAKIKEIVPEEGFFYWETVIQSGYEFENDMVDF